MTLQLSAPQTFLTALVGVSPTPRRHIAPENALQRLNYVTGRTLTESAVETEQAWVGQSVPLTLLLYVSRREATPSLRVEHHKRCRKTGDVHKELRPAMLAYWGPYLAGGTKVADVLALADDGELGSWRCTVVATGAKVRIVAGHFGDTFGGIVCEGGQVVAEISDGDIVVR